MDIIGERAGVIAALGTAICWTITSLSFEAAGKRVGSLAVNLIRLVIALFLFGILGLVTRGSLLPRTLGLREMVFLTSSGLVGFVIGDMLLFRAFVTLGARLSMLVFASAPVLTAILGGIFLGERLSLFDVLGMVITTAGIVLVVLKRDDQEEHGEIAPGAGALPHDEGKDRRLSVDRATRQRGILLALGGALGQAGGLVLAKLGAPEGYDPFSATQIRTVAGIIGFSLIFFFLRHWKKTFHALKDRWAMSRITLGAFFGPFLGVSLGLLASQLSTTGTAATIMATVPVIIIVPSIVIFRERITPREIIGALVAVSGVALLFV